ncbi:MAG: hypothetical protein P0S95_07040 [Rhabdochlamydiaceae bacterium]|nr:hypothetical protein [Candidatus Amphrikana amoebophyrae]
MSRPVNSDFSQAVAAAKVLANLSKAFQQKSSSSSDSDSFFVQDVFATMSDMLIRVSSVKSSMDLGYIFTHCKNSIAHVFQACTQRHIVEGVSRVAAAALNSGPTVVVNVASQGATRASGRGSPARDQGISESKGVEDGEEAQRSAPKKEKKPINWTNVFAAISIVVGPILMAIGLQKQEAGAEMQKEALDAFANKVENFHTLPGATKLSQAFWHLKDSLQGIIAKISLYTDDYSDGAPEKTLANTMIGDLESVFNEMESTQKAIASIAKRSMWAGRFTALAGTGLFGFGVATLLVSSAPPIIGVACLVESALTGVLAVWKGNVFQRSKSKDEMQVEKMQTHLANLKSKWESEEAKLDFLNVINHIKAKAKEIPEEPTGATAGATAGVAARVTAGVAAGSQSSTTREEPVRA